MQIGPASFQRFLLASPETLNPCPDGPSSVPPSLSLADKAFLPSAAFLPSSSMASPRAQLFCCAPTRVDPLRAFQPRLWDWLCLGSAALGLFGVAGLRALCWRRRASCRPPDGPLSTAAGTLWAAALASNCLGTAGEQQQRSSSARRLLGRRPFPGLWAARRKFPGRREIHIKGTEAAAGIKSFL